MEEGDIIVFQTKKTFPKQSKEYTAVIDSIEKRHVDCGVDGRIHKSNIVRVKG